MNTGWGAGAAGDRMGLAVPTHEGGGGFKIAGNMALCPVMGIIWQRTGVLETGMEIRGVVFLGKSFSKFFGEQV
jgi:hypothetical protein